MPLFLRPLGLFPRSEAPTDAVSLAGGRFAFVLGERVERGAGGAVRRVVGTVGEHRAWAEREGRSGEMDALLARISRPRPPFAGLGLGRPRLMGVVNVTPDSFSDGGEFFQTGLAAAQARHLQDEGAEILDIGGESTRPGADPVSVEEELERVLPVIRVLAGEPGAGEPGVLSIDSRRSETQRAAVAAGAGIINDVSALTGPGSLEAAAAGGAAVVLMHMQGEPATMLEAPHYDDVVLDVYEFLAERVAACRAAGIDDSRIAVDPGIGFGKTCAQNLALLRHLTLFHGLGVPILLGVSRKRFIAQISRDEPAAERLPGTLAACLAGLNQGVQLLRLHDVTAAVQARAVWEALSPAFPE